MAGRFRRRCRWLAARIRIAAGVTGFHLKPEYRSDTRTPWLGLLLWALACTGLFVSLLIDTDQLKREPRLAARETFRAEHSPMPGAFNLPRQVRQFPRLSTQYPRRR